MTNASIKLDAASLDSVEDCIFTNDGGTSLLDLLGDGGVGRTDDTNPDGRVNGMGQT